MDNKTCLLGCMIVGLIVTACGGVQKGSQEYVREQVYMCRQLCANAEVNITKIEGLDCVCNKPQQPTIIYNPIVTGSTGVGGGSSSSAGPTSGSNGAPGAASYVPASSQPAPIIVNTSPQSLPELSPKANATVVQDATGHTIISQGR